MLSDQQVATFERRGFLNAGPVFSPEEVDRFSDELDRIIEKGPDGFAEGETRPILFHAMGGNPERPVWQIVNMWEASPIFEELIRHPAIVKAISQLTGFDDLQIWHDQVQYKPAHTGGSTTWHQDAPLWPAIEPMSEVSAWIPFDDAEIENGCMWMVPGSHRWGDQQEWLNTQGHLTNLESFTDLGDFEPPADAPITEIEPVACPVKRGEVHFHHALTWHGSPENESDHPRRALAIHYMTPEARFTGRDHAMRPHIKVEVGELMANAGEHFPFVCRDGQPVTEPARIGAD
ncbi:MAG: phytanoyl-CoA dioxygenase family protein [Phycisphaeraceae bacterium]|nr:phytanoyl-CoA dioxygenase family protein [Phycisphaeraceae bacterium]